MGFGGFHFGGNLPLLIYLVMGLIAFAVTIPFVIGIIRLLNQTWLDPDWQAARRPQDSWAHWEAENDTQSFEENVDTSIRPAQDRFRIQNSRGSRPIR